MDAPEDDRDIKLQKVSGDFIADFNQSLQPFLRRQDAHGELHIRSRVRASETTRLTSKLLDPFQELPQLLDPHLPKWLPVLAEAYLEYHKTQRRSKASSTRSQLLEPLPSAICQILYTFCKIRGAKVVVRFFNVETKYLELLLSALEGAERARPSINAATTASWTWEERYIVLLWLSHLLLAPFDLATISSGDMDDTALPSIPNFEWPSGLPGITMRILPLAIKYLKSPGKERDGARDLLVRMAMRRDMQELGVMDALVNWALASLRPKKDQTPQTPHFYIGVLSFLAGVLRSSVNTSDMDKYLPMIFDVAYAVSSAESSVSEAIGAFAVARKMIIKVIRSVAVLVLGQASQDAAGTELVESSISYLLECLVDNDTPVRLTASKALSIITLKLDPDMAYQVVEAVLDSLNRNVLWVKNPHKPEALPTRDLGAVDPLEWHGLVLTLSHLLYRRSPPASQLPAIAHGLLLGLSFEKRSTSGGSIGTNVRDAACFGIWALARRYTTQELLAVPTSAVIAARHYSADVSILQVLATELIIAAALDSAGNIRRGSSAALQELIGRHPDTVDQGIWVVQTVDYHSVALRSRAIQEVALNSTKLSNQYGEALLDALLGWRGIGDGDAASRRVAGASFGALTLELSRTGTVNSLDQFGRSVDMILERMKTLQRRQVEERHGLLLCFAAVLDMFPRLIIADGQSGDIASSETQTTLRRIISEAGIILQDSKDTNYRRPELVAEGACRLIISLLPILQAASISTDTESTKLKSLNLQPGVEVLSTDNTENLLKVLSAVDSLAKIPDHVLKAVSTFGGVIDLGLGRPEKEAITAASEATLILLIFSTPEERGSIIQRWADAVRHRPTSRTTLKSGYFFALTMAHPITNTNRSSKAVGRGVTCDAILERWARDNDIETRVALLQSLTQSVVLREQPLAFLDLLVEGLDDYTTNARGDVGSHVRLEAIRATKSLWKSLEAASEQDTWLQTSVSRLFLRILRLAAEKLDRVRTEAHAVLGLTLQSSYASRFMKFTFSSQTYFQTLLSLYSKDCLSPLISTTAKSDSDAWMAELLAGYVTSADTGNEDLVIASRAALSKFCSASAANLLDICNALVSNLKTRQGQDRVIVPTLEIVAFLHRVGLFQQCQEVDLRHLCLLVQKAGYKTGNVRKLEACVKVYGCVAALDAVGLEGDGELGQKRRAGVREARTRLGALMFHPWPKVRTHVVDEVWGLLGCDDIRAGKLKSVDWATAEKGLIRNVVEELGLS